MKTIDTETRRKIFGLLKKAHEKSGSPLSLEDFRYMYQQEVGIASLSNCPASLGLKLLNRLHRIAGDLPPGTPTDTPVISDCKSNVSPLKKGPADGRPKWPLEWCGDQKAQLEKVEALLTDMELPWDYADSIAKRMFGNSVLRVDTLNTKQLTAVITALTKRQQKHGGRRTPSAIDREVHHG